MHRDSWLLSVILGSLILLGWATLGVSESLSQSFNLTVYVLAQVAVSLDFIDFGTRVYLRRANAGHGSYGWHSPTSIPLDVGSYTPYQKRVHLRPYALVASVYNAEDELDDFIEAMAAYKEQFWLIDDASTDETCERLQQAGWRCTKATTNRKKPGAIRSLIRHLPPEIETVVVVDPDISVRDLRVEGLSSLEAVLFDFQRSGMASVCGRIAIKPEGFLARFQALEYCMSFSLGRRSLADYGINSGAAIYRRDALVKALDNHSLSVYAEDFENSMILLGGGEQIYYDSRLVFETDAKQEWQGWFSQRVGWSYGLLKVFTSHLSDIWKVANRSAGAAYQFGVYLGVMSLLLHPLRLISMVVLSLSFLAGLDSLFALGLVGETSLFQPVYFAVAFAQYTVLATLVLFLVIPRVERAQAMPVVPLYIFYSLFHVVPATVGYANWFSLRFIGRRLWNDHYQDEASVQGEERERRKVVVGGQAYVD